MAWTIPTYAGTYMGGQPSNARTAMFELCRAVNERQEAIGIPKTAFRKADGTTGSDLTTGDLAQIKFAGASSNAFLNLKSIRDAIISMVDAGYFLETNGGTAWTKASLEADIGTDLDADPIRPQEARYWQAIQDALDRLVYICSTLNARYGSDTGSYSGIFSTSYPTLQDAWDARNETRNNNSGGSVPGTLSGCGWTLTTWAFGYRAYRTESFSDIDFCLGASTSPHTVFGTIASSKYQCQSSFKNATIGSVDFDIDGDTFTVNSTTSFEVDATVSIGSPITKALLSVDTTEPSTVPFSSVSAFNEGEIKAIIHGMKIYHDITPILTDQT